MDEKIWGRSSITGLANRAMNTARPVPQMTLHPTRRPNMSNMPPMIKAGIASSRTSFSSQKVAVKMKLAIAWFSSPMVCLASTKRPVTSTRTGDCELSCKRWRLDPVRATTPITIAHTSDGGASCWASDGRAHIVSRQLENTGRTTGAATAVKGSPLDRASWLAVAMLGSRPARGSVARAERRTTTGSRKRPTGESPPTPSYSPTMPKWWGKPAELERDREARHARRQLELQDQYLACLRRAQRVAADLRASPDAQLRQLISGGEGLRARFAAQSGIVMPSRRRATPGDLNPDNDSMVFVDECGPHSVTAPDTFPVFTLAAVVVGRLHYGDVLNLQWQGWKATNLGSGDARVHEPEVRKREGRFAGERGDAIVDSLRDFLKGAEFDVLACAVNRVEYRKVAAPDPLDATLPDHMYLFAMDVLFERIALVLDKKFPGGKAEVIAESRGPREDALLQYEFARLHLDGTSYIGDAFLRTCLRPGISFLGKTQNCTGLQLADLAARPISEKVADPASTPERWPEMRTKLSAGKETKHSILGLKIAPWSEDYEDMWES